MEVISVPIEKTKIHISLIYKTPSTPFYLPYLQGGKEAQTREIAAKSLCW
jgi:hypothetical protein